MASHPVLGTGAGTYEFTWLRKTPIGGTVRDAHSLYLEMGAESGIVGLLLSLALVVALLSPFAGLKRADPRSGRRSPLPSRGSARSPSRPPSTGYGSFR